MDQPPPKPFPTFTAWAIVGPVLVLGLGLFGLLTMPQIENGIYHGPPLAPVGVALIVACLVAVACSVAAFVRKERVAFLSLITALPALLLLVKLLAAWLHLSPPE